MTTRLAVLAPLLLAALALSGCEDGDGTPTTSTTTSTTRPTTTTATATTPAPGQPIPLPLLLAFEMTGCAGLSLGVQAPTQDVQALLPEGFVAQQFAGPTSPLGGAVIILDFYHCADFTTPAGSVGDTWFGHLYTYVEDPGLDATADVHEYMFEALAGTDTLARLWPLAGYPTHNGTAGRDDSPMIDPTGTLGPGSRTMTAGEYVIMGSGFRGSTAEYGPQTFARYTMLADGSRLQWTGTQTLPVLHEGFGDGEVPAESPFAGVAASRPQGLSGFTIASDGASFVAMDLYRVIPSP
jgi:hypothetical protein